MAIAQNFPIISPSLNLDFANVQALDPRITFARATTATYYGTRTALAEQNLLLQSAVPYPSPWAWTDGYIGSLGSELVTNGTFGTDVSGWTAGAGATITWVSGQAQVAGASATKWAYQTITTVIGRRYVFNYKQTGGTGSAVIWVGTSQGTNANGASPTTTAGNTLTSTLAFVATATTTFISLLSIGANLTANFDDLSVKESVQDFVVAPDGTSTASTLVAAAANATYLQTVTANAADYTFSVFLRRVTGTGDVQIQAGSGTYVTQTITSTWARYTVTQTLAAGSRTAGIRIVTSGDQVEVWGAQLEQRSTVTAYTPTTTQPITNYIPVFETAASGVARFDHNPVTFESLGLLVEEQRTNLFTYSEQFDNAAWTKSNATVTANTIVSPDGTLDADKLVEGTTTSRKFVTQAGAASGQTFSVYAKAGERNFIAIGQTNSSGVWAVSLFNLNTGLFVATYSAGGATVPTNNVITLVGNGWYRVSCLLNNAAGSGAAVIMVGNGGDPIFEGYTGNGFSGIYIWGAQLEAGAFATSYIPTVASQVTRAADSASMTGANFSSWFNNGQGTFYTDASCDRLASAIARLAYNTECGSAFAISTNSAFGATVFNIKCTALSNNTIAVEQFFYTGGGTNFGARIVNTIPFGANVDKIATYINNPAQLYGIASSNQINTITTNSGKTGGNSYANANMLQIGYTAPNFAGNFSGRIKKLAFYPIQVTATNLQSLTG